MPPLPILLLALAAATAVHAAPGDVRAVPTYEAVGLSWAAPGTKTGCTVRYRKRGDTDWRDGLDLWFDARNNECRGSIVYLQPGTEYEAQLAAAGGGTESLAFRTWPSQF